MNKQETIRIMQYGSHEEKMDYLNDLDTVFRTYDRNVPNASEIVDTLIYFSLASTDDELTDTTLEVICAALISQDLEGVDYGAIAKQLNQVPIQFLPSYIDILGYTCDITYLPDVLKFRDHESKKVRVAVRDALIEFRVIKP